MTSKELSFHVLQSTPSGDVCQAIVRFENGFGLSVLRGPGTLTTADRPYEAAVLEFSADGSYTIIYPEFTRHDVLSFLTEEQLSDCLSQVHSMKQGDMTYAIVPQIYKNGPNNQQDSSKLGR